MKPANEILSTALEIVQGDRAKKHGSYIVTHQRAADLWSVYLNTDIGSEQVAACMMLLKMARDEQGIYNEDDGLDCTGYSALWASLTSLDSDEIEAAKLASNINRKDQ